MSSYLSFYLVPKTLPDNKLLLTSYSRSSDIYQRFNDNLDIAYAGNDNVYTEITPVMIDSVIADLNEDITSTSARLHTYEKHANGSLEVIDEIVQTEKYLEELKTIKHQIQFLHDIVYDATEYGDFSSVLCNID